MQLLRTLLMNPPSAWHSRLLVSCSTCPFQSSWQDCSAAFQPCKTSNQAVLPSLLVTCSTSCCWHDSSGLLTACGRCRRRLLLGWWWLQLRCLPATVAILYMTVLWGAVGYTADPLCLGSCQAGSSTGSTAALQIEQSDNCLENWTKLMVTKSAMMCSSCRSD